MYGLGIGGIEKCLVNLVNALNHEKYDITIAVMNPEYDLVSEITPTVKIIRFEDQFINTTDTVGLIKRTNGIIPKIKLFVQYVFYRLAVKLRIRPWLVQRWLKEQYDYAIAYTHTGYVPNYVIDRTKAKTKVLWYHTLWGNSENLECYCKFDKIVAVSQFCKETFLRMYPKLSNKLYVLYNLYDFDDIEKKALEAPDCLDIKKSRIVTVGRLSPEKGYELAIKTCSVLEQKFQSSFEWFWVGDGPEKYRLEAKQLIQELKLEGCFHLLGNKINPYPYIKNCDVYVQPSEREAFCTTIIEARTLKKPIVTTEVGSFYEQLENGKNAFITEHTPSAMADKISLLMNSSEMRRSFSENCFQPMDYNLKQLKAYNEFFNICEGETIK